VEPRDGVTIDGILIEDGYRAKAGGLYGIAELIVDWYQMRVWCMHLQ